MNSFQQECIKARELIYEEVKRELLGPGSEDVSGDIEYELITDDPISRYSLGILFPKECKNEQDIDSKLDIENNIDPKSELDELIDEESKDIDKNIKNKNNKEISLNFDANEIDEKISMANELKPSSMGFTFFAKGDVKELSIRIKAAKYRESILKDCKIKYDGEDFFNEGDLSNYIYRDKEFLKLKKALDYTTIKMYTDESNTSDEYKHFLSIVHSLSRQCKSEKQKKKGFVREPLPLDDIITIKLDKEYSTLDIEGSFKAKWDINMDYKLQLCVFVRNYKNNIKSYTVVLCNNEEIETYGRDSKSIFQPELLISTNDNPNLVFIENRDNDVIGVDLELDEEEQSLDLLYKDKKNYAIGHGVATTQDIDTSTGLGYIKTSFLPYYDVKGITFDMDGMSKEKSIEILSMKNLSDYSTLTKDNIIANLKQIISTYNTWILGLEQEVESFEDRFKTAALRHITECKLCSSRIEKGIDLLEKNENAFLAFKLMNRALFMQRIQSIEVDKYKERFPDDGDHMFKDIDFETVPNDMAIWRPFQLAYILMCIESIADPNCEYRDIVDLIWVPTGGGKTEAYLGLTAFTIFLRRIENKEDDGTTVIMRYTLRLLAAQQFIRASILICACELIRRENEKLLGKSKITIGIWIGSAQTPNTKKDAIEKFKELIDVRENTKDNVFQVLKCPWCGTKLEKVKENGKLRGDWGYSFTAKEHRIFCTETKCPFSRRKQLPIEIIDEFIYENPPTLLFGTVDKFAMITWKGEASSLFALNTNNNNKSPELIIQDELHLISGPLGSIVGQYETAIDLLCSEKGIRPKIIASTATIRRSKEQCNQLYVRDVKQFPPSGLSQSDSFFTKEDTINPGRRYVGVMPSGKTLTTTQVRLMSALTNRINMLDLTDDVKSEYWTLVGYFNTLKELGMTNSLINADIQENIGIVSKRLINKHRARRLYNVAELTSRRSSNDINNTLKDLEIGLCQKDKEKRIYPIDVLLSSNMISVGVDIPRLNLMMVLQQPKLTSEYIQATSRVGRKNPGIVFTLYNPSRSRDKSHYEMFYDYHQSFYKYVEPTSVTSFAEPAIDRMLHSVFIALVRHISGLRDNDCARQFDLNNKDVIRQIENILKRVETLLKRENTHDEIIEIELEEIKTYLRNICEIWEEKIEYDDNLNYYIDGKPSLIKPFNRGRGIDKEFNTLQAMRNVDSQGKVDILLFEGDIDE